MTRWSSDVIRNGGKGSVGQGSRKGLQTAMASELYATSGGPVRNVKSPFFMMTSS